MGWVDEGDRIRYMESNGYKPTLVDVSKNDSRIRLTLRYEYFESKIWIVGLRYGRKTCICDIRYC